MDDGRARKRQEFTFSGNWAVQKQFSRYFLFADPANHHSASQTLTTLTTFNGAAELQSCRAAKLRRCDAATKYAGAGRKKHLRQICEA